MLITVILAFAMLVSRVMGHGYLLDPPARNTAWRWDPANYEPNYTDNELNCGGLSNQWNDHDGKCGICGDPYQGPYLHEAGGKYAKKDRTVMRCYNKADDAIDVHVVITSHHKGYFEFRLCEHNNLRTRAKQSCFDDGILLTVRETGLTRYDINENKQEEYTFQLDMPRDVTCTQCILQWKYNAGNNWGCDDTGCGIGLGEQEQFINCADIAILENCAGGVTTEGPSTTSAGGITTEGPSTTSAGGITTEGPSTTSADTGSTETDTASTSPSTTSSATTSSATTASNTPTESVTTPTGSTETDISSTSPSTTSSAATSSGTTVSNTPSESVTTPTDTTSSTTATPTASTFRCRGVGNWNDPFSMEWWCTNTCYHDYNGCPRNMCKCNGAP